MRAGEIVSTMFLSCGEARFQVSGYVNTRYRNFFDVNPISVITLG